MLLSDNETMVFEVREDAYAKADKGLSINHNETMVFEV